METITFKSSRGSAVVKQYVNAVRNSKYSALSVEGSSSSKIIKIFDNQREVVATAMANGQIKESAKDKFPPRG